MKKEDFAKHNHLKRDSVFILFIISLLFVSCELKNCKEDIKFGIGFNNKRKEVGLISLSDNWIKKKNNNLDQIWYYNPDIDSSNIGNEAFHYAKVLTIRNDSIILESDQFIGKESYMSSYGKVQEYLIYTYNFNPENEHIKDWTYLIVRDSKKGKRGYISKNEADSILSSWGFSYP